MQSSPVQPSLMLKRVFVAAFLSTLGVMNAACENKSEVALASAQSCLDSATTTSQANACAAEVSNDNSTQAYLIRCSANFIAQGVTGDRLASAYKQMDSSSTASNKTTALMAYMIFDDTLVGNTSAETSLNCQLSGVQSMYQLASAASLATTLANAVSSIDGLTNINIATLLPDSSGNVNAAALQSAVATLQTDLSGSGAAVTTVEANIGSAVQNSYGAFCATNSSFSSDDVCTKINSAVSSNQTPAQIGAALVALLQAGQ